MSANVYYPQTLVGDIAAQFGRSEGAAGLVVTLTQLGYGIGLLFVVPLLDILENRRLMLSLVALAAAGLLLAGGAPALPWLISACFLVGIGSVCVQILVPYASYLALPGQEGRVVGLVTAGLMAGIMLARPAASLAASFGGWRTIFFIGFGAMALCGLLIRRHVPQRQPSGKMGYRRALGGMWRALRDEPVLRRRLAYQAALFSTFSMFWTVAPLELAGPDFGLGQRGIAIFALAGAMSVLGAPLGGLLADRGYGRAASGAALALGAASFALTFLFPDARFAALLVFFAAALLLDLALTLSFVIGQRTIFALGETRRGSLNGIFMAGFYSAGAVGSGLGGLLFAHFGWPAAALAGSLVLIAALVFWLTEPRPLTKESHV